jgi:hypothetical protein
VFSEHIGAGPTNLKTVPEETAIEATSGPGADDVVNAMLEDTASDTTVDEAVARRLALVTN